MHQKLSWGRAPPGPLAGFEGTGHKERGIMGRLGKNVNKKGEGEKRGK